MSIEDALNEIDRVKGRQLDEKFAKEFIKFVKEHAIVINDIVAKE